MARLKYLLWLAAGILGTIAPRLCAETVDLNTRCEFAGEADDMNHTTQKLGMVFRVGMQGVSYSGQLKQSLLEQSQPGKVTLWLSLRNVKFTIKQTSIVGGPGSAACGPMEFVLAQKKDLWLAFDIEADAKTDSGQMVVKKVRCQVRPDNLAIGNPAWVRVQGIGYTQQKVVDGLRQGIVQDLPKIQERLTTDAPKLLAQIVKQTSPENAESPLVEAIRSRLETANLETTALSSP